MKTFWRLSLLLLSASFLVAAVNSQTRPIEAPTGNASISGRLTAEGKPLAGLHVVIQLQVSGQPGPFVIRTDTDTEGRYQFTALAAGSYQMRVLSPIYTVPRDTRLGPRDPLISIGQGETVTNFDLALVRGGVVTGKIVDPVGRPLIEAIVQFYRIDEQGRARPFYSGGRPVVTDDRGIYRAIGVPPGRYRVSSGEGEGSMTRMSLRKSFPRTFHPETLESTKASIVDVGEGSETTGIDIRMHAARKTFAIVGRAVDAESNQPAANANISVSHINSEGQSTGFTNSATAGPDGQFRLEAARGGYLVFAGRQSFGAFDTANQGYSDPVKIELIDSDVTGIEVRVKRGGSISGIATVEGTLDPAILATLPQQSVAVYVEANASISQTGHVLTIAPDGRFRVEGLRPGRVMLSSMNLPDSRTGLSLWRIERAGVQTMSIELGERENISDVKLVFVPASGVVRGQVMVKGDGIPKDTFFFVSARSSESRHSARSARTDARGAFVLEGLPPGEYAIQAMPSLATPNPDLFRRATVRQSVTVSNGQTVQLTLTIDLTNKEERQ